MKKAGILTFHDAHNYGAVLQAYALKKYINKLGIDANIINYHHYNMPNGFPKKRKIKEKTLFEIRNHIYSHKDHNLRWTKFDHFIKNLTNNEKRVYTSEDELEKLDLDFWICGSDQIWNTDITRGINKGLFLDFNTKGRKISYAASMGIPKLDEEYEPEFIKSINGIEYVSVREDTLKKYIKSLTDKEVTKVVDPTLLLEKEDYEELLKSSIIKEKYLLIYALGPDDRLTQIAKQKAEEKDLKIVELNDYKLRNYFCEQISNAGPEEFLTLIKNAEVIVTNSFHGTVFSALFEKDFYTITRLNRNARMESLLDMFNMRDRLIDTLDDLKNVKVQNYEKSFKHVEKEVENSKKFLKIALNLEG